MPAFHIYSLKKKKNTIKEMSDTEEKTIGQRIVLGLDISTSCTGVSIAYCDDTVGINPAIVTHLRSKVPGKIKGIEALFLKCDMFMDRLDEILTGQGLLKRENGRTTCAVTDVVIEEPLLSSNNQNTVATLLRYNGIVAYRVFKLTGVMPSFISSYDARKYGAPELMAVRKFKKDGGTYDRNKVLSAIKKNELSLFGAYKMDCAKKYILWNIVSDRFPNITWIYDKKGELAAENFDASDSLICIMGYIGMLLYEGTEPVIRDSSVKECADGKVTISYTCEFCGSVFEKKIELGPES